MQEETAKRKTGRQTDRGKRQMKMGEAGEAIQMLPLAPGTRSRAALTPKQKRNPMMWPGPSFRSISPLEWL